MHIHFMKLENVCGHSQNALTNVWRYPLRAFMFEPLGEAYGLPGLEKFYWEISFLRPPMPLGLLKEGQELQHVVL